MYEVQDWAEVHRLFHREGWAKTRIAEQLGMSRNTVGRLLELGEPPRYDRKAAGSKLDPHKGSIARMLDMDPKVSARVTECHEIVLGMRGRSGSRMCGDSDTVGNFFSKDDLLAVLAADAYREFGDRLTNAIESAG